MILTMRASTWVNNRHELENDNDQWYTGVIADRSNASVNVPLFTIQEIKELCLKINPAVKNFLAIDMANNFNHPLYFQFYYKEHKNDFAPDNIDHVCIYELISAFILNKVYLGQYSTEKLLLLSALVDEMDFANSRYDINKLKVNTLIKQYNAAYQELLSIGFLKEMNISSDLEYNTTIKFGNCNFLEYTIAKVLLLKNNYVFDTKLIDTINTAFQNNKRKLYIIKWCVIYAIKTGQQRSLDLLTKTQLSPNEKSDLLIFLGELLEKSSSPLKSTESIIEYFNQDCSDELFNYFFGLEFISADYKKTLKTLLKFNLSTNKVIVTYTALAAIAVLQLDTNALKQYLDKLKSIPADDYRNFAINPTQCIEALYQFFKYGIINKPFFKTITRFYFNTPAQIHGLKDEHFNDLIGMLAGYALLICHKPYKMLRFVSGLKKSYKSYAEPSPVYKFFMDVMLTNAHFLLGDKEKTMECFTGASRLYNKDEHSFTPYMRSIYYGLKIRLGILNNDTESIPAYLELLNEVGEISGNRLTRLVVYNDIINSKQVAAKHPGLHKQIAYSRNKLLRESGLNTDIFTAIEVSS